MAQDSAAASTEAQTSARLAAARPDPRLVARPKEVFHGVRAPRDRLRGHSARS